MTGTNRNEIAGVNSGSRGQSVGVACGNFLDQRKTDRNFPLKRSGNAPVNFLLEATSIFRLFLLNLIDALRAGAA